VALEKDPILFRLPSLLGNGRIEMIVPTFPTLLSDSARQMTRNKRPFLGTALSDQLEYGCVFIVGPRSLDETRLQDSLPAVHALHFSVSGKVFGNRVAFETVLVLLLAQALVLLLAPLGGFATTSRATWLTSVYPEWVRLSV
jgi:hypothetical protein